MLKRHRPDAPVVDTSYRLIPLLKVKSPLWMLKILFGSINLVGHLLEVATECESVCRYQTGQEEDDSSARHDYGHAAGENGRSQNRNTLDNRRNNLRKCLVQPKRHELLQAQWKRKWI